MLYFLTFPHFIPLFILNFDVRDKKLADCKILYFEKNHKQYFLNVIVNNDVICNSICIGTNLH